MAREGFKAVLIGEPNVGKSSILNGLLNTNRSIVTQIPGTTRDTIEEFLTIEGIPVSLTDTAGIHETDDEVEKEGINRSYEAIKKADLLLWVIDLNNPSFELELPDNEQIQNEKVLLILNKADIQTEAKDSLPKHVTSLNQIKISAKDPSQVQQLRDRIFEFISGKTGQMPEDTAITNLRQKLATENSLEQLKTLRTGFENNLDEELLAVDLAELLSLLGDIVGETTPDDMFNQIFENFCIGK